MPSTDKTEEKLNDDDRTQLLTLADASIREGLAHARALRVDPLDYSPALQRKGASFVTLQLHGGLRGCIGHLEAFQPLVLDVAENAFAAAFRDPRFQPLRARELPDLEIEISILSSPEPCTFGSEEELLQGLRPGIDGLILARGARRATFLPSVWESLPDPREFLRHLKMKAGFSADYWSPDIQTWRYQSEKISAPRQPDTGQP